MREGLGLQLEYCLMIELVVVLAIFVSMACAIRWTPPRAHLVEVYVKSIMISTTIVVVLALGFGLVSGFVGPKEEEGSGPHAEESRFTSRGADGAVEGVFLVGMLLAIGGLPLILLISALGALIGATPVYLFIRRSRRTHSS